MRVSPPDDDSISLDDIGGFQSFSTLQENPAFQKFLRLLHRDHRNLFPGDMDDPSDEDLMRHFASHPSIWNTAENYWANDVKKEGTSLEVFQEAQHITAHIRRLIAHAIQRGTVELGSGEERGAIFDFHTRKSRPNRLSGLEHGNPEDKVGSDLAEMGFDLSPAVAKARIAQDSDEGYTALPDELYGATQHWLKKAHSGWEVQRDDIIYMRDALSGVQGAVKAFVGHKDQFNMQRSNVVVCTPGYGGLLSHPKKVLKKDPKTVPLIERDGRLAMDTDALRNTLEKGDVFILCNPHNPTGHVYSREELLEIKEICKEKDVKIIADESHDGLVFNDDFVSIGSLYDQDEPNPTATLVSSGKPFNLSDQPCHMLIIPDEDMRNAYRGSQVQGLPPTAIPNRSAIAAFTQSDQWRTELLHYLKENCDLLEQRINSDEFPGMHMTKPEGTFLAWIDASEVAGFQDTIDAAFSDEEPGIRGPAEYFAKVANVSVANGADFDTTDSSNLCFRLNFAVPQSDLNEMLDRMRDALAT